MERMDNIFCWNTIGDWMKAYDNQHAVIDEKILTGNKSENLRALIDMAVKDCFPLSFSCFRKNEKNLVKMIPLMMDFLCFINNEAPIVNENGAYYFFSDLPVDIQQKIFDARIGSVWIRE